MIYEEEQEVSFKTTKWKENNLLGQAIEGMTKNFAAADVHACHCHRCQSCWLERRQRFGGQDCAVAAP
jgi:hypothetical protein